MFKLSKLTLVALVLLLSALMYAARAQTARPRTSASQPAPPEVVFIGTGSPTTGPARLLRIQTGLTRALRVKTLGGRLTSREILPRRWHGSRLP